MGIGSSDLTAMRLKSIEKAMTNLSSRASKIERTLEALYTRLEEINQKIDNVDEYKKEAEKEMVALQLRNSKLATRLRRIDALA